MPGVFRLLERVAADDDASAPTIELAGARWSMREYANVPAVEAAPPYSCISYAWGIGRMASPFDRAHQVSDRAIAVADATIRALQPPAIWLDAFCVPVDEPARGECLQNMGAIYAAATQVVVVLSKSCCASLEQIKAGARLDPKGLLAFENDSWVTRAWNYQEIANSRSTQFICEGGRDAVDGEQFLNSLGHAMSDFRKSEAIHVSEFAQRYPSINDLEDTLADYMVSNYLQRFAFQVMTAMDRRRSERPEDHFNAMIGALPEMLARYAVEPGLPPAERFMRACEARGDYSFIYCVAARSPLSGRTWRPAAEEIPAVLCWHTFGDGQPGVSFPTHLELGNMCRMKAGAPDADAAKLVKEWIEAGGARGPSGSLAAAALDRLRRVGFSGCGEHLEFESGYFFPQTSPAKARDSLVVVPAGIRWAHGGPGLLLAPGDGGVSRFRDVGVFVGRVPQSGEAIHVA